MRISSDTSADNIEQELDTRTIPELPYCMSSTPEMMPVDRKCNVPRELSNINKRLHSDSRSPTASVEDLGISMNLTEVSDHLDNSVTTNTDALIENDVVQDLKHNMDHIDEASF